MLAAWTVGCRWHLDFGRVVNSAEGEERQRVSPPPCFERGGTAADSTVNRSAELEPASSDEERKCAGVAGVPFYHSYLAHERPVGNSNSVLA